jgi:hypothetical protein
MASCRLIAPGPQEAVILPQQCWLPPLRKKPMHHELGAKIKRLWLRVLLLAPYFMLVVSLVQVSEPEILNVELGAHDSVGVDEIARTCALASLFSASH